MADSEELLRQLRATLGKMEIALGAIAESIVWLEGSSGRIQWCNAAFARLIGRPYLYLVGTTLVDLLPLKDEEGRALAAEEHPVHRLLHGQSLTPTCYQFQASNPPRILEISGARSQIDRQGVTLVFVTLVLVVRDVTERVRVERTLAEEREQLARVNRIMMEREARVMELKREVNALLTELHQPPKYQTRVER